MSALPSPEPVPLADVLVERLPGAGHPSSDVDRGGPSVLDPRLAPFLDALVDLLVTDLTRRPPRP